MKKILLLLVLPIMLLNSCKEEGNDPVEDADLFVGTYIGVSKIEIEKVDENSINLNFIHNGDWTQWNHTFYAKVDGNLLTIPAWQYWQSESLNCRGDGFLVNGVLTINYYYSNGNRELGVTYDKIK